MSHVEKEGVWVAVDHASRDLSFSNAFVRYLSVLISQNQFLEPLLLLTYCYIYISDFFARSIIISRAFLNLFLSSFCCKNFPFSNLVVMSFLVCKLPADPLNISSICIYTVSKVSNSFTRENPLRKQKNFVKTKQNLHES